MIATDILRNSKVWLLDIGIESSIDDGELIATRLITPGPFSMTAGVMVPFEIKMLEPICMLLPQRIGNSKLSRIADDRRFAQAVYNVALADGVMDRVRYLDHPADWVRIADATQLQSAAWRATQNETANTYIIEIAI